MISRRPVNPTASGAIYPLTGWPATCQQWALDGRTDGADLPTQADLRGIVQKHVRTPVLQKSRHPTGPQPQSIRHGGLGVERLFPFSAHHPGQRRQSAAQQAPLKIIPSEIFLAAIFAFDATRRFLGSLQKRLLRGSGFLTRLDPIQPVLMAIPPDFIPELLLGGEDGLVVAAQEQWPLLPRILLIRYPLDLIAVLCIADAVAVGANLSRVNRVGGAGPRSFRPQQVFAVFPVFLRSDLVFAVSDDYFRELRCLFQLPTRRQGALALNSRT